MHIDVITEFNDFSDLRANWERVYDADPEAHFFLSWQWLADWLTVHRTVWFVLAAKRQQTDADYIAFLPLRLRTDFDKKDGFYNELFFAGDGFSDYAGVLTTPEAETEAVPALAEFVKRRLNWARFKMDNLTMSDRRRRPFLRTFDKLRFVHTPIEYQNPGDPTNHTICPAIRLPGSWDDYLQTLSSGNRQKIRRLLRRVDAAKDCRITSTPIDRFDQHLKILLDLWKIKWAPSKGEERASNLATLNYDMLSRCAANGTLFLPVFWQRERPVAAVAILVDPRKRSLLFFIAGRDESYRDMPAGYLLHAYSIRHGIAHGFTSYDFLKGNEPYKFLFAPQMVRQQNAVSVAARTGRNIGGRLDPRGLPAMLGMTLEFESQDDPADAELGYRQILELAPDHALALYRYGRLTAERGAYAKAEELLARSVAIEPDGDNAWLWLGKSRQALGQPEPALAAYREVVKRQPLNREAKELILALTMAASEADRPATAEISLAVAKSPAPADPVAGAAALDADLALRQKVRDIRSLTQDYLDAFVTPRPRW